MADDPTYKRGDTWPPLYRQLRESIDGGALTPIDLTAAESVKLVAKAAGGVISRPAVKVADPRAGLTENGWTRVDWTAGDLDVAAVYKAEHEITWTTVPLKRQTVPNDDTFALTVVEDQG